MPQRVYMVLTEHQLSVLNDALQSAVAGIGSGGGDFDWSGRDEEVASSLADGFRDRSCIKKLRGSLVDLTPTEAWTLELASEAGVADPDYMRTIFNSQRRRAYRRAKKALLGAIKVHEVQR